MAKKILVVDDEPALRLLIAHTVAQAGYEVCESDDGSTAQTELERARFAGTPYDAVVSDVDMPSDGIELVKNLRAPGNFPDMPVVLFTGRYKDHRVVGMNAGATIVMKKLDDQLRLQTTELVAWLKDNVK